MTAAEDNDRIAATIAELRSRYKIPVDPQRRGPVPLNRFLEEHNLLHVALPVLSRGEVVKYLRLEGSAIDERELTGDPEELLAGCLLTTATDGYIFVGQHEPYQSATGERKVRFTTQPRQRFTVAHEFGHFILHRNDMLRFCADTKDSVVEDDEPEKLKTMERQANRFAAELLMPAEICAARAAAFRKAYRFGQLPTQPFAYHLAAELLVSTEAMRYRLKELKVCGDAEVAHD